MNTNPQYDWSELINNQSFINWVREGKDNAEWQTYFAQNPHLQSHLELATSFIKNSITKLDPAFVAEMQNEAWSNLNEKIASSPKLETKFKYGIAIVTLILILGVLAFFFYPVSSSDSTIFQDEIWVEYTNNTNSNVPVDLSDGSQVILEPQSYLRYPNFIDQKNRKVQLKGDAFFDIARDTTKPFYIYANEAVIRVLGTSFHVKADEDDKEVKVVVKTGKVAVYSGNEIKEYQAKKIKKLDPLLVTPNQVATLQRSSLEIKKRLVSRPTLTKPLKEIPRIHFKNASIREIAAALSAAYSIEIEVNPLISDECRLTTTLTDQPLYEKLKIICDPLGLTYREKNVKILITGSCDR